MSTQEPMQTILVATRNPALCDHLERDLGSDTSLRLLSARSLVDCPDLCRQFALQTVLVDAELLLDRQPLDTVEDVLPKIPRSLLSGYPDDVQISVLATRGHFDQMRRMAPGRVRHVLQLPLDEASRQLLMADIRETGSEVEHVLAPALNLPHMLTTRSSSMTVLFDKIRQVADTSATVLITGETGTGKGVLAQQIHELSAQKDQPFIPVHCGSIPEMLIESELFGHERGAFTGAVHRKRGKFEQAGSGTLFLDEVGTMTPSAQIKLLQVLQDKTFTRVGGEKSIASSCRIIAATNMDLGQLCDEGLFRRDLYYRLNIFPLLVPPLRKRRKDIPGFLRHFLTSLSRTGGKQIRDVAPEVLNALTAYDWPGNVRELENTIHRAYIMEKGPILTLAAFPSGMFDTHRDASKTADVLPSLAECRTRAIEEAEARYLNELMRVHEGRIQPMADAAGVSRRQVHNLLNKYGLRTKAKEVRQQRKKGS